MKRLPGETIKFFERQGFVIVSTIDTKGTIHISAKGIVGIEQKGVVYLLDLYRQKTFENLKRNSHISLTAVDEGAFRGYVLKGRAKIFEEKELKKHIIESWEKRIVHRISQRIIQNVKNKKSYAYHPEALLPRPEYLIKVEVKEIIDLTPRPLKTGGK
jgi:uncharacterized pyridoxamine 5'-phosphate oxidase family protein